MMKEKHQKEWGRTSGYFNDQGVMGTLVMKRAGIRRGALPPMETHESRRSLKSESAQLVGCKNSQVKSSK